MHKYITVNGARENNLKNVKLRIPRNQFVVFTGVSGSGKSSLAFDTLHSEGQMRYIESLSSYARLFLGNTNKPDVDSIDGLSPAIAVEQKTTSNNPRSTVGTVTEIYDYLRLLWARVGVPHCPNCKREIRRQSVDQIIDTIQQWPTGTRYMVMAPIIRDEPGEHTEVLGKIKSDGFARVRINGEMLSLGESIQLKKDEKHTIDIVIDRLTVKEGEFQRLTDSLETAFLLSGDVVNIYRVDTREDNVYSQRFACTECGLSLQELSPRMFSFNNQYGACRTCTGLGYQLKVDPLKVAPDRALSLKDNGIAVGGWSNPEGSYYSQMYYRALGEKYSFDLDTPLSNFTEAALDALFYGTKGEKLHMERSSGNGGDLRSIQQAFEGIINQMERRYRETQSEAMRKELESFMSSQECPDCGGNRLHPMILAVLVEGKNISDFCKLSINEASNLLMNFTLSGARARIAEPIIEEIQNRLHFLQDVGLEYLTLSRAAGTLSGGESQRIRLATQIGSGLTGVLYILDEPSIGLHQRDNNRLLSALKSLRDLGNTLIVVEHDEETMRQAEWIVDIGPGAGTNGGEIVAQGAVADIINEPRSLTGQYLSGEKHISVPRERRKGSGQMLTVFGAAEHNLKDIDVSFPLGTFICVTGVSGSGKSSLVNEILYKQLAAKLNRAHTHAGKYREMEGIELLNKVINVDQTPIGRTPRSNPATYTGLFDNIRSLFAMTNEAKLRGYDAGRFSFNIQDGRCEACTGEGLMRIGMHFLPDVYVPCDVCKGKRYNRETLEVHYKGKSIADVLDMTALEASAFFENLPKIRKKVEALCRVGLGYIKLGQASTTLSGGEAQRVKLATELLKPATGSTLYIMDEPTTGLHVADVHQLIHILHDLVDGGNTVVVIEHNLDLIKNADHIIDLGPEGGPNGGTIICSGTPEEVAACSESYTGRYLDLNG
ncbi:excinuclease ABC subunit UvrA [Paenibacillus sp. HN-1]|uniref:excinuclease ABC subunit UvrA n=1 Tax=Paenibacillus TaxID=44249 RepID=UPI001CA7C2B7|nr:excinuclease ABC subunit UvrA [Paenibacillus sp. CGMCC 1.18879]MBY9081580.1 excinuclease ABC subunit UvrA [Paenibacillus sp. CGMCC 1.18879]MBY9087703.1 excinuclease ABC subunit UvrA [Paenibacillus sinensis]